MAFEDVTYSGSRTTNSETMNFVSLRQLIDDFIVTMDSDDYISNVSDVAIRNIALRGIREFGFDVSSRVRSIKRTVQSNNTIILPEDYVDIVKLGVVDGEGTLRVFGQNKNLNYSRKDKDGTGRGDSDAGPLNIPSNLIEDREDDKTSTTGGDGS